MSTLEKLLVLGVLILVGVILAISLFWNRPDTNNPSLRQNNNIIASAPGNSPGGVGAQPPAPPSLDNVKNSNASQPAPGQANGNVNNGSQVNNPANVNNGPAGPTTLLAANGPASKPAGDAPILLSRPVPSAFVTASPSPSYYVYKVQKGDTPRSVSKKLTNTEANALLIDKAVDGQPLVPGKEILIPAEVFNNVKNPADAVANHTNNETLKTGPGTSKASTNAKDPKVANDASASHTSDDTNPVVEAVNAAMYTVKRGDSLRKIARVMLKDERRWKEIQQLNQLKSDVVREGQKIKLPR